ncbi:MAG: flagellar biosynthetic protein FliR [Candidatus Calescibacterium sp.]|nr:flagellar biosynthetic protein FliR [Candidatus Calescibacterium sp.]MCX7734502.1 flagellar biosynthetic protein FliR [bacterium]MDW8088068.1 flagellar biosynthetic protein FliR [Candidatus Calescibacterium sp.]
MEIFNIFWDPQRYLEFLPFFIRTSFFILSIPIFTAAVVPAVVRAGMAFAIALSIYSGSEMSFELPMTLGGIIAGIVNELILSFLIFLTIRIFFLGPQLSGEVVGFQIGYSLMTVAQPFEETQLSVIADLFFISAMMLFFALDLHIAFFWGLKKSFELVPPFAPIVLDQTKEIMTSRLSDAFSASIQISLPLILMLFIVEISIAIISRTVPQFNLFVIGFPLKIIAGVIVMTLLFDRIIFAIGEFIKNFVETYSDILKLVR